ncbi:PAAR domain-containing protein [Serratia aquatilis]|uniref:PAAR domain-containing protein n=1 Tax=Serratia aquatilis TaxID=1737515 RepID=A0ABV6E7D2_9GAMM
MAKGYYLVVQDKTTCGGIIIEGDPSHTLFGKAIAREQDRVTCGKHPGMYIIVGHIPGDSVMGRKFAGTLHSKSSCPCQASFIPSMMNDTYEFGVEQAKRPVLSPYVTGEKREPDYVPDYPATALINTCKFPDDRIRAMLEAQNQDVMLLTAKESYEILACWSVFKKGWVQITQSGPGQIVVNYGLNGRDAINTSILIAKLGSFGIKATVFVNHKGTELIKISGYPGVRKVLNAPVFSLKNPKVVDIGIGRYGLAKSVIEGARLTIYVAAAYRTVDYILNDQTTLAMFIGSLATDVAKVGIVSAVVWGAGALVSVTPFVVGPLVIVVAFGFGTAWILNTMDEKFGITDKVVKYIEAAQQEFVWKAREMENGVWDLYSSYFKLHGC